VFSHVVLIRLRRGVTLERVRAAREALAQLIERLPGVLHFGVTDNLAEQNAGFTLMLVSVFEDRAAFEIYRRHPEARRVRDELLAPITEQRLEGEGELG
jgi:quinol monooxygenase YgiN